MAWGLVVLVFTRSGTESEACCFCDMRYAKRRGYAFRHNGYMQERQDSTTTPSPIPIHEIPTYLVHSIPIYISCSVLLISHFLPLPLTELHR